MRARDEGAFYSVSVSAREVRDFADRWPCSGMRDATRGIWFQFDKRRGDLVDLKGVLVEYDEGAVRALSEDAQSFGRHLAECANCGGPLPEDHGIRQYGKHRFCDRCAGYPDALRIGQGLPVTLYAHRPLGEMAETVTSWTGEVMGAVTHKSMPDIIRGTQTFRKLGAARYRVRMLDGSMWWGHGPTENGTYVRLRKMVRQ